MRGLLDDHATRWSRERAAHSRCRGPIGAKTDGRVKIIKLLSGFDTLDWTPPLLWLWQRRHDREVILCPSPSGRRSEKADVENLHRIPSARTIARLMTVGRDTLSKAETITVAAVEAGVPTLVEAREIVAEFHGMIRRRAAAELSCWTERARASLIASFARGVTNDEAAVRAAIISPWSNGQTEGQITRLKLVRRQMYGRGKLDLLQARLIGAQ
jgi:transposase